MKKTKTLVARARQAAAPTTRRPAPPSVQETASPRRIARMSRAADLGIGLVQRAAAGHKASAPVHSQQKPHAEVNESADYVVAAITAPGQAIAGAQVVVVTPGASYQPLPGMVLRGFLHRNGSVVKFIGHAGGVHLGREQAQIEFGPLLAQCTALFQNYPAPSRHVEAKPVVHREADGNTAATPNASTAVHHALSSNSGRALDQGTRSALQASYGVDLSDVRVHTNSAADVAAKSVHAHAFTVQQDIYFRAGQYQPHTTDGLRLLAHEVAHTVQQSSGAPQVAARAAPGEMQISEPGDPLEREAEAAANSVLQGESRVIQSPKVTSKSPNVKVSNQPEKPHKGEADVVAGAATAKEASPPPAASPKTKTAAEPQNAPSEAPVAEAAPIQEGKRAPDAKSDPVAAAASAGNNEAGASATASNAGANADAGLQGVIGKIHGAGAEHRAHEPAAVKAAEAQAAAQGPANDVAAQAAGMQLGTMHEQPAQPFDRARFLVALLERIEAVTPQNLEEADNFKKNNKAGEVKAALTSTVAEGKSQAQGNIAAATQAPPNEAGLAPKPVTELKAAETTSPSVEVGAHQAVAAPRSEAEVSLHPGSVALDQQMTQASITHGQLAESNEPGFQQALDAKQAAQTHATQAPAEYRQAEASTLGKARAENVEIVQKQLGEMAQARGKSLTGVYGQQSASKAQEEQKRAEIANNLQNIYEAAKSDVTKQLDDLDAKVNSAFDAGASTAQQAFENHVGERMTKYKDERYSGPAGWARWVKDKVFGMPPEVNAFYVEGKRRYIASMKGTLEEIAGIVEKGLTDAKARIALGKQEVDSYVQGLDKSLQGIGREAAATIQTQFGQLEQSVADKQTQIIDGLTQRYQDKLKELNGRIAAMREENAGLTALAAASLAGVVETIAGLRALLLGVLSKAGAAVEAIVANPIRFLGHMVAGVKLGFLNFVGKIGTYLKQALLDWLFGALATAGVQMPQKMDLSGVLDIVMQVLGLTYANIRRRAVRLVGEKIVGGLETGAEIFVKLITQGPMALWEWIKEKVGGLIETVLDGIKSFLIDRVIMAGVTWIVSLLNPASAFVKACKAIYDIILFFIERGQQVAMLVTAILDAMLSIAKGDIAVAAQFVEASLAKTVPVVIGFLASVLGLGGISESIKKLITKIQEPVNAVIDWVIQKAVSMVKSIGGAMGFGKKDAKAGSDKSETTGTLKKEFRMHNTSHHLSLNLDGTAAGIEMASPRADKLTLLVLNALDEEEKTKNRNDVTDLLKKLRKLLKSIEDDWWSAKNLDDAHERERREVELDAITVLLQKLGEEKNLEDLRDISSSSKYTSGGRVRDEFRGKIRPLFYGGWWADTIKWRDQEVERNKNPKNPNEYEELGKDKKPTGNFVSIKDRTIDHIDWVVEHWNKVGRDLRQNAREEYFNDTSKLRVVSRRTNSLDGLEAKKSQGGYKAEVGPKFLGPDE